MANQDRSPIAQVEDRIIYLHRILACPPSRAFELWTQEELLTQWLAPEASVEARTGGAYELFWQPADRESNSTIGCRITAFHPDQVLGFQWRSPAQYKSFANTADPLTHVSLAFAGEGAATRLHLVHTGWRSGKDWEEARLWQIRAWEAALQVLQEVLPS